MRPRDYVVRQIRHRQTSPVPFTLEAEGDVAERLDIHYGGSYWRDWLTPYVLRVAPIDTWQLQQIDEAHGRDVFGTVWQTNRRPWHIERPALGEPSFDAYEFPRPERFLDAGKKETARRQLEAQGDSFRVASISWGLFERTWTIRGFENALVDVATRPDFYEELLDRLADLYMALLKACLDLPVDAIMFGDDWGDQRGVIIGPARWRRLLKPRWAKLYHAVHDAGKLVISHCCGSVADIMPDIIEMGLDVLESVQPEARGMNPYELKKKWGEKITFWGGLGSQSTVAFGTPEAIQGEVRRLCEKMGRGGGYILAPAKPLQPETPTENAVAVLEAFVNQTA